MKDIVPRGFHARIEEIQGKHQEAIEKKIQHLHCSMMIDMNENSFS